MSCRIPLIQKSLGILLVSLQGEEVIIELKNDIEITGIIEEADENMNLTLHNVQQVFPSGYSRTMDLAFVNGTNIRYVHIPSRINAVKHLGNYITKIQRISKSNQQNKRKVSSKNDNFNSIDNNSTTTLTTTLTRTIIDENIEE